MKPNWYAIGIYLVLTIIWGSTFILIKKGLTAFTPLQVASIRMSSAFIFLLPFAIYHLRNVPRKLWWPMAQTGILGSLLPAFLFSEAQKELSSAATGILAAFTPVWALLISKFVFKAPMTWLQVGGTLLGFIGSGLLIFQGSTGSLDFSNWRGLLVLLATLCYGINLNIIKYRLPDVKGIQVASLALFFIGPPVLAYTVFSGVPEQLMTNPESVKPFLYVTLLGASATGFAVIIFYKLLRQVTAVFASTITYATAIIAVLWGVLDGETLNTGHYLAMVLTIGGIVLIRK